jgi:DNA-binding transcriptional LysR family regulator
MGWNELEVVVPATHRFASTAEIPLDDLDAEPLIMRETSSGTRRVNEEHLQAAELRLDQLHVVAELTGIEAIKAAVEAGLGVTILSRATLANELALRTLVSRPLAGTQIRRTMFAVTIAGGVEVSAARELTGLLAIAHSRVGYGPELSVSLSVLDGPGPRTRKYRGRSDDRIAEVECEPGSDEVMR